MTESSPHDKFFKERQEADSELELFRRLSLYPPVDSLYTTALANMGTFGMQDEMAELIAVATLSPEKKYARHYFDSSMQDSAQYPSLVRAIQEIGLTIVSPTNTERNSLLSLNDTSCLIPRQIPVYDQTNSLDTGLVPKLYLALGAGAQLTMFPEERKKIQNVTLALPNFGIVSNFFYHPSGINGDLYFPERISMKVTKKK